MLNLSNLRVHSPLSKTVIFLLAILVPIVSSVVISSRPMMAITAVVLPAFAIICLLSLRSPKWGFLGLIAISPGIYVAKRLQFGLEGRIVEYNNILSLIPQAIVISILLGLMFRFALHGSVVFPRSKLNLPIFSLIFLSIVQMFNPSSTLSVGLHGFRVFSFALLAYFIGLYAIRTRRDVHQLLIWISVVAVVIAAYGLKQVLVGFSDLEYTWVIEFVGRDSNSWFPGGDYLRIFSALASPFDLATFMMMSILLLMPMVKWVSSGKVLWALLLTLMATLMLGTLFATANRGAWVGLAGGMATIVALSGARGWRSLALRCMLVALVVIALAVAFFVIIFPLVSGSFPPELARRVQSLQDPFDNPEMRYRFRAWREAIDFTLCNPLGKGLGTTGYLAKRFELGQFGAVDDVYIKVLVETGWIGLGVLLWVFYTIYKVGISMYFRLQDTFLRAAMVSILGVVSSVAIYGIVIPVLETQMSSFCFWFLVGAMVKLGGIERAEVVRRRQELEV